MAQVNTKSLDYESFGLPAQEIYDKDNKPNVDTRTLDFESWGLPVQFLFFYEEPAANKEVSRAYIFSFPL